MQQVRFSLLLWGWEYVAVGTGGTFLTSPDAEHWTRRTRSAFVSDTFVFVGPAGMILQTASDEIFLSGRQLESPNHGAWRTTGSRCRPAKVLRPGRSAMAAAFQFTNAFAFVKLRDERIDTDRFYRVVNAP
jgi:hypothetical protein